MEALLYIFNEIDVIQLIAIGIIMWFFYSRLDGKISDLKQELKGEIKEIRHDIQDLDKRLCRIEGSLSTSGHCLFSQPKHEMKAE